MTVVKDSECGPPSIVRADGGSSVTALGGVGGAPGLERLCASPGQRPLSLPNFSLLRVYRRTSTVFWVRTPVRFRPKRTMVNVDG